MVLIFTKENDEWVRHDSGETHSLGEAIFKAVNIPYDEDDKPIRSLFDNATEEVHGNLVKALNSLWFQDCGVSYLIPEDKFSSLHVACSHFQPQLVAFLVGKGANVQVKSTLSGYTPLHILVEAEKLYKAPGRLESIKVLLESLPEPQDRIALMNQQDSFKLSILHLAAHLNQWEVFIYLAKQPGINWSLRNRAGWTPIHFVCDEGTTISKEEEKELFKVELDPAVFSLVTHKGDTCLHVAARAVVSEYDTNPAFVEWLLSKMSREDVSKQNSHGQTAWDIISTSKDGKALSPFIKRFRDEAVRHLFECPEPGFGNSVIMSAYMNDRAGAFANLKRCRSYSADKESNDIVSKFQQHFLQGERNFTDEQNQGKSVVRFREPSCLFDYSRNSLSLVFPFFTSQSLETINYFRKQDFREAFFFQPKENNPYCHGDLFSRFKIYLPLTLDEYCSPALSSKTLNSRNEDQVMVWMNKEEAKHKKKEELDSVGLITVSQLWIGKIGDMYIVSQNIDLDVSEGQIEIRDPLFGRIMFAKYTDAYICIGIMISKVLENLGDPSQAKFYHENVVRKDGVWAREQNQGNLRQYESNHAEAKPVFNEFEKAITHVSEQVNTYLGDVTVENISIEKEKRFIHDISDIRDELAMIKRVVFQQEEVWKDFAFTAWPEHWPNGQDGRMVVARDTLKGDDGEHWRTIMHAQTLFGKYRRRIEQLDEDADRVERAIITKLELMAKHATLKESHATSIMSAAVFGFTIVTIIFTPLSFFASLFALPIDTFQNNQVVGRFSSEAGMYPKNYVGKYIAIGEIVSLTLTLLAMWGAVRFGMNVHIMRKFWAGSESWTKWIKERFLSKKGISKEVKVKLFDKEHP